MTIDQEKMLCELIEKLDSADFESLLSLARDAYNKALDDVEKQSYLCEDLYDEDGHWMRIVDCRNLEKLKI